jgi:hypothetical protein
VRELSAKQGGREMSELVDWGEAPRGRPAWVGRLRRPLLLIAVTALCGLAYLAGIWSGMKTDFTCVTSKPGLIVCGSGDDAPFAPAQPSPKTAKQESGSA